MWDVDKYNAIQISIASPEIIRQWSHGEVKKPETINYRTHKAEKEGLFCERIFGPTRDWTCFCQKYKSIRYKGIVCERCGVEITKSAVRRERMGHIELACPVAHIWYSQGTPSYMALLLDISPNDLKKVLYFNAYIVTDPGSVPLNKKQILTELEYRKFREKYGDIFKAGMGAETIRELLREIDIDNLIIELQSKLGEKSKSKKQSIVKRLEVAQYFKDSLSKPEWMIVEALPVIPPDLRPMVQLDGGRFATSDLNDLYRRVINRNNRLKRLISLGAPDIIIKNEKRMLQEAVNSLIDNSRHQRPVTGAGKRPLKSLNDMLKGKQGRFRQNLLGKRVDYSGRSVIVVGPSLKFHQCGLPKKMALELFKPFVMNKLVSKTIAANIKKAKKMIERESNEVWDVLEEVIRNHPVLLNRAPTLHRYGIQAFEPVLVEGKAIQIHPLVCHAFNADFDGDQMAVHIPLLMEAQAECRMLMLATHNLFTSATGNALVVPAQDMAIGIYYLTKCNFASAPQKKLYLTEYGVKKWKDLIQELAILPRIHSSDKVDSIKHGVQLTEEVAEMLDKAGSKEIVVYEPPMFASFQEGIIAYENRKVGLTDFCYLEYNGEIFETSPGRLIFNSILPESMRFINYQVGKGEFGKIIKKCYEKCGNATTINLLDDMKQLGFHYATISGTSISIKECKAPLKKSEILGRADDKSREVDDRYLRRLISREEKSQREIEIWMEAQQEVSDDMIRQFEVDERESFNSVYMMAISGARGNIDQIKQLAGMRGLMSNPQGDIMDFPIKSNFREGLKITEYFISTYGARKGLVDTALRTADSGYLTRRLVEVAQELIIKMNDCGTEDGITMSPLREARTVNNIQGDEVLIPLRERLVSRYLAKDVIDPKTGDVVAMRNQVVTEEMAARIEALETDLPLSEELIGLYTAEAVLDPTTHKVIIRPDRKITPAMYKAITETSRKIEFIRIRPEVTVRSALTCGLEYGFCQKCYGLDLATGKEMSIGDAAGIIAAQSIGEPGTQLTMRTFHIGGIAQAKGVNIAIKSKYTGKIDFTNLEWTYRSDRGKQFIKSEYYEETQPEGEFKESLKRVVIRGFITVITKEGNHEKIFLPTAAVLKNDINDGDNISAGKVICEYNPNQLHSEYNGKVKFSDDLIVKDDIAVSDKGMIIIEDEEGDSKNTYLIPQGSYVRVENGDPINAGDLLAEIVAEQKAAIAGINGHVEFLNIKVKNQRVISDNGIIYVIPENEDERISVEYKLPSGIKEGSEEEENTKGYVLRVTNGSSIKFNEELLTLYSEIEGDVREITPSEIVVKKDARKEYIIENAPEFLEKEEKNEQTVEFVTDVAGTVDVLVEKSTVGKNIEARRVVVKRECEYNIPACARFTVDNIKIKSGEEVHMNEKITGPIPVSSDIEGTVEVYALKDDGTTEIIRSDSEDIEEVYAGFENHNKRVQIKNIKKINYSKKVAFRSKLLGKTVVADVVNEETGDIVLKKGETITDEWLKKFFLVTDIDGEVAQYDFKKVYVKGNDDFHSLEQLLADKEILDDVVHNETGKEILKKGQKIDKPALTKILSNNPYINYIKVPADRVVVKKEREVEFSKKDQKKEYKNGYAVGDIVNPKTGEIVVEDGELITQAVIDLLEETPGIKTIAYMIQEEFEVPNGAKLKVKDGDAVSANSELVLPTYLSQIEYIEEEAAYIIPKGFTMKVKTDDTVKKGSSIIEKIDPIVSEIDGKVNYKIKYDGKTGEELVEKITVYSGKEFVFPTGVELNVKKGDVIEVGQPITKPIVYHDLKKEDDTVHILCDEKQEKKYALNELVTPLVQVNDSVNVGDKLAVLLNDRFKNIKEVTENIITDEYDIFTAQNSPFLELAKGGRVIVRHNGKDVPNDGSVYSIMYATGEIHFNKKVKGKWTVSYRFEEEGVVRLLHKKKGGKAKATIGKIVVMSGEAHQIVDGSELKVEDSLVDLRSRTPIIDKIEGKLILEDLKNLRNNKMIIKKGEMISRKTARKIDRERIDIVDELVKNKAEDEEFFIRVVDKVETGTILARFESASKKTVDIIQGLPRVAELFEVRKPKKEAIIAEETGRIKIIGNNLAIIDDKEERKQFKSKFGFMNMIVNDGEFVDAGERLTEGSISPKKLLKIAGRQKTYDYLISEIQRVYRTQGVKINDKHVEVIVSKMMKKVKVVKSGDTGLLPGEILPARRFYRINAEAKAAGRSPATKQDVLQGITKVSLTTDSFMSAASFQETTRVLTKASIKSEVDVLRGLKENLIIGKLIPAGTGMNRFKNMAISTTDVMPDESEFVMDDNEVPEEAYEDEMDE